MKKRFTLLLLLRNLIPAGLIVNQFLAGCAPKEPPVPKELVLYSWVEYMPQSVVDAFTKEFGIQVQYLAYETQEEATENIEKGIHYDLVLLGPEFIAQLAEENMIRRIDRRNVPNFKHVSANFRDLAFDPGNEYSIPFHWGTTGLLVRTDLVDHPITSWNDLWDPAFAGKVGIWPDARSLIPITLKTIGYSANSETPAELERARKKLMQLKPQAVIVSLLNTSIVPILETGDVVIGYGWAYDAVVASESDKPIDYIIPEEGSILWTDHFVIPASSTNPGGAELFLNFILQPEIAAQIINESFYPMAVDGTEPYVLPEILKNSVIFPDPVQLEKAEVTLPIHSDRKWIYDDIWADFMEGFQ